MRFRSFIKSSMFLLVFLVALPALAGEGRTPIFVAPSVIAVPGRYIVTRDLVNVAGGGVLLTINAPDVDIDLNGFVLDNSANPLNPVIAGGGLASLTVRDGVLIGGFRGIQIVTADKITIEDLKINGPQDIGIYLQSVRSFAVRRNLILEAGWDAMRVNPTLPHLSEGTIEDNVIRECGVGIGVYSASSVGILNNRIEEVSGNGPVLGTGIYLDNVSGSLISENTIEFADEASLAGHIGIKIVGTEEYPSRGNKLFDNVVHNAGFIGIDLDENSHANLIVRNVVTRSVFDGLRIGGDFNYVDSNLLNINSVFPGSSGLVFLNSANDNTYGKNTARGQGGPGMDFRDFGVNNTSFGDNLIPGPPPS